MKYFVVALIFSVICNISASDDSNQTAEKFGKECADKTGLTPEEVLKILSEPKSSIKDPKAQKFAKCFFGKIGFIDNKGDILENVAIEKLSEGGDRAKIEEMAKQCKSVIGPNKDENPIKLYACYFEKSASA